MKSMRRASSRSSLIRSASASAHASERTSRTAWRSKWDAIEEQRQEHPADHDVLQRVSPQRTAFRFGDVAQRLRRCRGPDIFHLEDAVAAVRASRDHVVELLVHPARIDLHARLLAEDDLSAVGDDAHAEVEIVRRMGEELAALHLIEDLDAADALVGLAADREALSFRKTAEEAVQSSARLHRDADDLPQTRTRREMGGRVIAVGDAEVGVIAAHAFEQLDHEALFDDRFRMGGDQAGRPRAAATSNPRRSASATPFRGSWHTESGNDGCRRA